MVNSRQWKLLIAFFVTLFLLHMPVRAGTPSYIGPYSYTMGGEGHYDSTFAADVKVTASNSELAKAEKVAKAAFKEAAGRKVKNFSWRLIVEDQTEWVVSFEDLDAPSVPGSDYFITVKKEDFKASVRHGY